jgi:hypothetical protein
MRLRSARCRVAAVRRTTHHRHAVVAPHQLRR